MRRTEGLFAGWNNLPLYYQCWRPDGPPRAIVALVHGLGSHSGLFDNIVQSLLPQGYQIYALDLRGHGRSPGQRGYINAWHEFHGDLDCFLHHICRGADDEWVPSSHHPADRAANSLANSLASGPAYSPPLPIFLIGHSLGGVISLDYAIRQPDLLAGVVAIAPALGCVGVPPLKLHIGKLLSKVWPGFTLSTGLNHAAASRDPKILCRYQNDPLRHAKGTARLATEFLNTTDWLQENASHLQCPLLILHGSEDQVARPEGSDRFFKRVQFPNKTRYEYDGGYHDLHNDTNFSTVLQDLSDWLRCQWPERAPLSACPISLAS